MLNRIDCFRQDVKHFLGGQVRLYLGKMFLKWIEVESADKIKLLVNNLNSLTDMFCLFCCIWICSISLFEHIKF